MSEMLVQTVSLTIVVRDKQEDLICPSASLFQNMDPGQMNWSQDFRLFSDKEDQR